MYNDSIATEVIFEHNWEDLIDNIPTKVFVIDKIFFNLHRDIIIPILNNDPYYLFDAKESDKNITNLIDILSFFQKEEINRAFHIVCIGGGITTDIGSFAASIYMRGCKLVLLPTTFLGMIDASIGGKTAINFQGIKNNVGSFYCADQVIINSKFLESLPRLELINGWAECVKVALIDGNNFLTKLSANKQKLDDFIISEAIKIKNDICSQDPFDNEKRQLLNLGHSVGHIIEVISNFSISHGKSVAIGLKVIAGISYAEGFVSQSRYNKILKLLSLYELDFKQQFEVDYSIIYDILKQDKKNRKLMSLVLFSEKSVFVQKMTLEEAVALIEKHIYN